VDVPKRAYSVRDKMKRYEKRQGMQKKIIIIAGPNGAGKTTFARSYLPEVSPRPRFINADLIAAGLSPFSPEEVALKAGRLMLNEMEELVRCGESFTLETTLSGRRYLSEIRRWRQQGYHVSLYFLKLSRVEIAISRVAERVRQGGHDIPEAVIRRRFVTGLQNFESFYKSEVDSWVIFDNDSGTPLLLESKENE